MFDALKVNYAGTLLGCVAAVLVPIPVIFYKYGARIRSRSSFAPTIKIPVAPASASLSERDSADG